MQNSQLHFYLLPSEKVFFENIENVDYFVTSKEIKKDCSLQGTMNALKYRYGLKYLGKSYEELFVLCIPAQEHLIQFSDKDEERKQLYPKFIKTSKQTEYSGFASGRRSAIWIVDEKMIRYKGCGNDTQGFVVENKGLRGSHFFHTAKRQLFMTQLINKILLESINAPSANSPLFFYQFPKDIQSLNLKNEARLISKYCCVFQTIGDRRIGTHLISPLEIIFLNIVKTSEGFLDQIFKRRQRLDQYGLVYLLTDFQLSVQKGDKFLEKYDKSRQFTNYVSIEDINKQKENPLEIKDEFDQQLQKMKNKFGKIVNINLFPAISKDVDWIKIVDIILRRVGWQMGQVKRIFCEKQINWGFFNDHGYWHCNAHLNNFITSVPKTNQRFIYPLDFDLAFTKDEYINIDPQSQYYGEKDDQDFQQLLLSEYNSMQMSVSGEQIMNFKYSIEESKETPTQEIKQLRIIFRDTLVKSFRDGMRKKIDLYEKIQQEWNDNINEITKLIEFSLLLSADFQT